MPSTDVDTVKQISGRLDSTIMFTLIRFVYNMLKLTLDQHEIILFTFVVIVFIKKLDAVISDKALGVVNKLVTDIGSAVLSQAVVEMAVSHGQILGDSASVSSKALQNFIAVTGVLILATVLPDSFRQYPYVARCITLLLYMYTDAMQGIVANIDLDSFIIYVCVFLYILLHRYQDWLARNQTLQYLTRAMTMLTVNVLQTSIVTTDVKLGVTVSMSVQAILLCLALFFIDTLAQIAPTFSDSRNYAMWKGAQQLHALYDTLGIDFNVTVAISLIALWTRRLWTQSNSTIVELSMLVLINVALSILSSYISNTFTPDKSVILFMYVEIIHIFQQVLTVVM